MRRVSIQRPPLWRDLYRNEDGGFTASEKETKLHKMEIPLCVELDIMHGV